MAAASQPLPAEKGIPAGTHEQNPEEWWRGFCDVSRAVMRTLKDSIPPLEIAGVAVTSTSGTLVVTDTRGRPLRPAILYDDTRSGKVAEVLNTQCPPTGMHLNSSQSLVKAVWVRETEPDVWSKAGRLLHPSDWLTGNLTGNHAVADSSNALKLGFDPQAMQWSEAIERTGLPRDLLPRVVGPGEQVGRVTFAASEATTLPAGVPVMAGATDGMTSLISSGASQPGHANSTLGTTLVWKVLATERPPSCRGIYSHLHPSGLWAPGAASNAGPGSLRLVLKGMTCAQMDQLAAPRLPTNLICYVLSRRGERFPFLNDQARGFVAGNLRDPVDGYAAQLQSLGFVERWGYESVQKCGIRVSDTVFSTGGAAASPVYSQLRADIMGRTVKRCCHPYAAFGAAILAASGTIYVGNVRKAIESMTRASEVFTPAVDRARRYDEIYYRFRTACRRRGYDS